MTEQDQSGWSRSVQQESNFIRCGSIISKEHPAGRAKKPYTITKQRERWTEDEAYTKFLEALKLACGYKDCSTDKESHAQEVFLKGLLLLYTPIISICRLLKLFVNQIMVMQALWKPIKIPPPRPRKRYPYPRKLATPVKSGTPFLEKSMSSLSPNMSMSEQENQSPTSVLSVHGSDALGTVDSSKHRGSASPVSSAAGRNSGGFKLELFPQDYDFVQEGSAEASSTLNRPSCPTLALEIKTGVNDEASLAAVSWNVMPVKLTASDSECASSTLTLGTPSPFYILPSRNENQPAADVPLPLFCHGEHHKMLSRKRHQLLNAKWRERKAANPPLLVAGFLLLFALAPVTFKGQVFQ
ncbi:hypothetical protein HAX54_007734 [Datura stramonium]|uniref:Uncharacterized protein n=1 Tax=Datura stramonium TaxID=4076 RepID=A0ABS8RIF5_DATST|nr:hypothetical protein [Datura stramonium]